MPKLTYFNVKGRPEPVKYMLALADVEYEQLKPTYPEWIVMKPTTPMGQLPIYQDEGVEFTQTAAITRYVAQKYGFMPEKLIEKAQVDQYMAHIYQDVFGTFVKPYFASINPMKTPDERAAEYPALWKTFAEESKDKVLAVYEKALGQGQNGYLVAGKLTAADIIAAEMFNRFYYFDPNALDNFPKVKEMVAKVHSLPKIKAYLEKMGPEYL